MERLKIRYVTLTKAVKTLNKPIKKLLTTHDTDLQEMLRDSLIKRFEYCYEALWQLGKQLLEDKYAIKTQGPASIFRELFRLSIITQEQLDAMLAMSHDRNQTSHTYKEEIAKEVAKHIATYQSILESLVLQFHNYIE